VDYRRRRVARAGSLRGALRQTEKTGEIKRMTDDDDDDDDDD
jgi:hypothetical protein